MTKLSKKSLLRFKFLFLTLTLFITSVLALFLIPKLAEIAQGEAFLLGELQIESHNLKSKVSPMSPKPITEVVDTGLIPPQFSAGAVLALDLETGKILYQKNVNEIFSPASTTKIMTALVSIEHFQMADVLKVPEAALVGGSSMGLNSGEKLTFRSLLYGMLLNSGNDAAYTIALNYPGGIDSFVSKMNEKAKELNLLNTHFDNPAGFDSARNFSSASDLARLAQVAQTKAALTKIFATKETAILSWDRTKTHLLKNLNKLLGTDGVQGIKTGYTEKSGENLVGLVSRQNHSVITVVLRSDDRFGESERLINWIYNNFSWKQTIPEVLNLTNI